MPSAGGAGSGAPAGPGARAARACARAARSLPPPPSLPTSPPLQPCTSPTLLLLRLPSPATLPPPLLHPPRHAPYGPSSPAKSREPRDLPICMPRRASFRPLCGPKKVAHLSPVRDSADQFLPAGEINPFRRRKGGPPPPGEGAGGVEGGGSRRGSGKADGVWVRGREASVGAGSEASVREEETRRPGRTAVLSRSPVLSRTRTGTALLGTRTPCPL